MGLRIPKSIQEKVIKKWLQGKTRDEIAKECKISGGSVTHIIQSRRSKDREFDLWRVIGLQMRERDITMESLALYIRLHALTKKEYLNSGVQAEESENRIDSLVEALVVFCFNRQMTVPEFGNQVHRLDRIADELGIPLARLPDYARLLVLDIKTRRHEIDQLISNKKRLLEDYGLTTEVINDIHSNPKYLLGAFNDTRARLRDVESERNQYKDKLMGLQMERKARKIKAARKRALRKTLSNLPSPSERE